MMLRVLAAVALFGAAALGCGSPSSAAPPSGPFRLLDGAPEPSKFPVEVITWWPRGGDSDALSALIAAYKKQGGTDEIISATAELSGEARSTLRRRMWRSEPPDLFQANVGHDLMQWVLVNGIDDVASKIAALDDIVPDVATWRRTMPARILQDITYNGKIYGVPSNIHRVNTLFYNKHVFAKYGLAPPRTVSDLFAIGKRLEGTGVRPFALGTKAPWVLSLFVFECLLVAREGPEFYDSYFRGRLDPLDPRIRSTLNAALDLLRLFNEDHARLTWLQGIDMVVRGDAAMTLMGDWGRGAFNSHGWKVAADYDAVPFPGTESALVYTSDAFAMPLLAKNPAGAIRLLETIGSVEGQEKMNATKDALSPRLDVPLPPGEGRAADHALLEAGKVVLALSGIVPPRFESDLAAALGDMDAQQDIEPVLQTLRTRYALLR